jgi:hypothetical protein
LQEARRPAAKNRLPRTPEAALASQLPVAARFSLIQALTGWSDKFTYWDAGFPETGPAMLQRP